MKDDTEMTREVIYKFTLEEYKTKNKETLEIKDKYMKKKTGNIAQLT